MTRTRWNGAGLAVVAACVTAWWLAAASSADAGDRLPHMHGPIRRPAGPARLEIAQRPTAETPRPDQGVVPRAVAEPLPGESSAVPPAANGAGERLPRPPMSLEELQRLAVQYNPTLVQARMAVQVAQGQQVQAGLYPNPQIGYAGADIGLEGTSGQQGAVVGQEFVTGGKLRLARAVSSHEVAAARHALQAQQWRVLNDVRWGFYEVLVAQQMVEINRELVKVGQEAADITSRLRRLQEVTQADVLQASIEAERARIGLFRAENRYRTSWRELAATIGRPELAIVPLTGDVAADVPTITWDAGIARLLSQSPELARANAQLERARCDLALQAAERYPNIGVDVIVKYDEPARDTLVDASVVVPLKIFDRNQGNILSARAALTAAAREVERVELELYRRFAEAYESYANSRHEVGVFRATILDQAKASLDLTATGYREGEFSYLSLLTAERTYFAANLEYLASLRELWAQAVALDGLLLTGGLEPVE